MEYFIIFLVIIFLGLGVLGSIVPALPGPPLSYVGLLLVHFMLKPMSGNLIFWLGVAVVVITILDYWLQVYGVKKAGGGKYAIRGSVIGMLLGIFLFPPFGILIGAFTGAYLGAKMEASKNEVQIALGALWGFISGTILKLGVSIYIIYIILF